MCNSPTCTITEDWSPALYDALQKFDQGIPLDRSEEIEVAYHFGSGNNR